MMFIEPEKLTQEQIDAMSMDEAIDKLIICKAFSTEYMKVLKIYSENMKLIADHLENTRSA